MKVLVTGVAGQLGYDVVKELNKRGYAAVDASALTPNAYGLGPNLVIGVDRSDFDITDEKATEDFILKVMPDAVIHCAAYTAVDAAEDNVDLCRKINVDGTENIARVCAKIGAKMLYISTDYVFPGDGDKFYGVDDITGACNVYGQSKLDGELTVKSILDKYFIVRTSWVFGHHGKNFVETMLRLGKEKESLNVVNDQIGSPTFTEDLAVLLADMVVTNKYGIYHATNEGVCSWAEFAMEIMKQAGLKCKIVPITSAEYPTKAKRPFNSRLSKDCLDRKGFERLPEWQGALREYLETLGLRR